MAGPSATAPIVVSSFHLPAGRAVHQAEIGTFQNILKSDLDTGNVEKTVYDQIQHELARAAGACSAGKGGEAHSIIASSKEKPRLPRLSGGRRSVRVHPYALVASARA